MAAKERTYRMCDVCGQVDTDPRHVMAVAPGDGQTDPEVASKASERASGKKHAEAIMQQIMDTSTIMRHMDCCREEGCPDGSCDEVTAGAEDLRGEALVNHLTRKKEK